MPESSESIRGSYAMIDPQGRFFDSSVGEHTYSDPILCVGVEHAFSQVSFDRKAYEDRGGSYDFNGEPPILVTSPDVQHTDKLAAVA